MKYWIYTGLLLVLFQHAHAQFDGGEGDGHDKAITTQTDLQGQPYGVTALYTGGQGDGHDKKRFSTWMNGNPADLLYSGGSGDGEDRELISTFLNGTSLAILYTGGEGDGHEAQHRQSFLNNLPASVLYSGGTGDGHDRLSIQSFLSGDLLDMLYSGGDGDGHDQGLIQGFLSGADLSPLYSGGGGDGHDNAVTLGTAVPFPVALLSFDAFPEDNYVIIQWVTESELNNDFFTVERSTDSTLFGFLENVSGAGTTTEIQTYETIDPEPFAGRSYYRLKATDFDGVFTYSQIVEVNFNAPATWNLVVYPNPNSGKHLNLKLAGIEANEEVHVEIVDMRGQTVWQQTYLSDTAILLEQIDLQHRLAEGTYLIRASTEQNQLSKLVIVR